MNLEQKEIATKIILFIKNNGNTVFKSKMVSNFLDVNNNDKVIEYKYILANLKDEYNLINIKGELISLTKKGFEFTSFEDLEIREKLEFKKLQTDLSLAENTLKEFPKTKWFARIGFIIAILLMLKELYILIWR